MIWLIGYLIFSYVFYGVWLGYIWYVDHYRYRTKWQFFRGSFRDWLLFSPLATLIILLALCRVIKLPVIF